MAANILADVLTQLTPVIVNQLKPGGIYITSGIIDDKEQTVVEAVKAAGLEVLDVTYQGEWVCVTARSPFEYQRASSGGPGGATPSMAMSNEFERAIDDDADAALREIVSGSAGAGGEAAAAPPDGPGAP